MSTSFANISKGWSDLVAPAPPAPPAPPGQQTVQQAQQVAKDIRLVQQTIGGIMSLIALPKEMLDIGFANLTAPLAAIFPSLPSATITTLYLGTPHAHAHPPSLIPPAPPVPLPSMGPVTLGTCVKVLINSLPAARVKDLGFAFTCGGLAPIFQIKTGSSNVFIGGHRAARMGDICVACVKGESRSVDAGAFMSALGTAASIASKGLQVAGMMAGLAGVVADAAQAAVEDDAAMASAMALAAAMAAAQMAADAAAMALSQTMGTDPGIPPSVGALLMGHPTVLIGGFPMIDIPNPINMILDKLSQFKAQSPPANGGCGKAGEPVDIVTGDNVDENLDYESAGPMPFRWRRYYNSAHRNRWGPLGYGHRHEYQRELEFDTDGFRYTNEKGEVIGFPALPAGKRTVSSNGFTLRRVASLVFRLQSAGQHTMEFQFQDVHSPALLTRMGSATNFMHFHYDADRKLIALGNFERQIIHCHYDQRGQLTELGLARKNAEADQILAAYQYDAAGNLVQWTDALGFSANFAYDSDRRMTRKTDRRGYSYHYRYGKSGRCIHTYGDDGLYDVRFKFMPHEHCTQLTYSDGGVWTYLYNDAGTITEIIDPYGGIRARKQDETGRVVEEVSPGGRITRLLYDNKGVHTGRRDSLGYCFPPWDQRPHPPNPLAHRLPATPLEWEHGTLLRRDQIRDLSMQDLQELPKDVAKIIAGGQPSGAFERARDSASATRYDAMGRPTEEIDARGRVRRWKYDPNGNVVEFTDGDGATYRYEYASWNLLRRKIDPLGNAATFQYSACEKITKAIDAGGTASEYTYDHKNRLVKVFRNGDLREEYRYDAADNLIAKVDGNGEPLLTFEAGPHNLHLVRRLASGESHYFEYNEVGRFTKAATDESEVKFEYNPQGRLILDQRDGKGIIHKFAADRLTETVFLERFITKYAFDREGRLNVVDPTGGRHRLQVSDGGLFLSTMSNGSSEFSRYDRTGRCLLKVSSSSRTSEVRWTRSYEYSAEGDLIEIKDNLRGAIRYEYDAAHRLVGEILPERRNSFQYDPAGNLLRQPGLRDVTIDGANRLGTANGDRFAYNRRNHVISRQGSSGVTHFSYDSKDMLVDIEDAQGGWKAQYDPLGRRVSKSWGSKSVEFYWDNDRLAAEILHTGSLRLYIYPDAAALVPIMFVDYESIDASPESGQPYFIRTNQIGVPIRVEDDKGKVAWTARISPYGQAEMDPGNRLELALRFPGHYHDPETGLFYNRFRYYSPELGRYLQSDPIGIAGGINVYRYTASPLTAVDLIGHHEDQPEDNEAPRGPNAAGANKEETEEEPESRPAQSQEDRDKAIAASGMVPEHVDAMSKVAQDNDTVIIFQNVNPDAAEHLEEGASPKPMSIKAKTAEDGPAAGLIPLDQSQSKAGNDPKYQAYADQSVANGDAIVVKAPDGETDVLGDPKTGKPYTSDYDLLATGSKNPPGTVESDPQLGNVTPEQRGTISDLNDAADNEGGDVVQHGPANQAPTPQPVNYPVTALDPDGSVQSLNNDDELQNYMSQKQGQGYNF